MTQIPKKLMREKEIEKEKKGGKGKGEGEEEENYCIENKIPDQRNRTQGTCII